MEYSVDKENRILVPSNIISKLKTYIFILPNTEMRPESKCDLRCKSCIDRDGIRLFEITCLKNPLSGVLE